MDSLKYVLKATVGVGVAVGAGYLVWTLGQRALDIDGPTIRVPFNAQRAIYLRVPQHLVPQLLGSGGERIHRLEIETHTSIHFEGKVEFDGPDNRVKQDLDGSKDPEESGTSSPPKSDQSSEEDDWVDERSLPLKKSIYLGYRKMSVQGDDDGVREVERRVNDLIRENTAEEVAIPDGCNIVGAEGRIIHRIQDQSGAKVHLEGTRYTSNRVAIVIGNDQQRTEAKRLIAEVVDEFKKNQDIDGGDH